MPQVTAVYTGLFGLLFLYLSVRVILSRRKNRVSVGDGDNAEVLKAMRTQSNCIEYVPIGAILLLLLELQGISTWVLHALGLTLLVGRGLHAYGFGSTPQIIPARIYGMGMTLTMISTAAILNIVIGIF